MTSELLRIVSETGDEILVEVDDTEPGYRPAGRDGAPAEARKRFEQALVDVRNSAVKALGVFRDEVLQPDAVEIEFGVRFNGEAGAVIARTAVEGHLRVKLMWGADPAAVTPARPG